MEYWRAVCERPLPSTPGGMMATDCPSSTGKGIDPRSRTTWWVSLANPASVQLKLPTTVAVVGCFGPYRLLYACAADQGGAVAPKAAELNGMSPVSAAGNAGAAWGAIAASSTAKTPSAASCSAVHSAGSSSQVNCSSIEYAFTKGIVRQLSIEPVG